MSRRRVHRRPAHQIAGVQDHGGHGEVEESLWRASSTRCRAWSHARSDSDGNLRKIMKNVKAAQELVRCATKVPTVFDRRYPKEKPCGTSHRPLSSSGIDFLSHLEQLTSKHTLIVTDATLARLGIVARIEAALHKAGIKARVFARGGAGAEPANHAARRASRRRLCAGLDRWSGRRQPDGPRQRQSGQCTSTPNSTRPRLTRWSRSV